MRSDISIAQIFVELENADLLPAIVFRTSRDQCDRDVMQAGRNQRLEFSRTDKAALLAKVQEFARSSEIDLDLITSHPQYESLVQAGVGAHHAGQLLVWRLLLEELMSAGLLRILIATGTVAAGVDFPARTVVITAHSKRGSEGFQKLTAAEFQQMSGRAGRRGKDTVGFCVIAPTPYCDARQLSRVARRAAEPLKSSYFPGPSSVLNLLRYRNVDDLEFTVDRSLASFLDRQQAKDLEAEAERARGARQTDLTSQHKKKLEKRANRLDREAAELKTKQQELLQIAIRGLQNLGFIEGLTLSEKGYWSSNLCTSLVLELAELIEAKVLQDASPEYLAALVGAITGDSRRGYLEPKSRAISDKDLETLSAIVARVQAENLPGVSSERVASESAAYTVMLWMQAENWNVFRGYLFLNGVAEGDAARLITQTADQLNQLTRLYESHPMLAQRAEEAKRKILRPPLSDAISTDI
ncbi:hypothetical protein JNK13_09255 [bacterium]|nr:hypothetical protein [bacterium]